MATIIETKQCSRCCKIKPTDDFHRSASQKDGLRVHCKECMHLWYEKQKERQRAAYVLKTFGVTLFEIEEQKIKQGGRCKICFKRGPLEVDHDHVTSKFRGMLCANCNKGLGHFKDCIQYLMVAQSYLEEHDEQRRLSSEGV